MDNDAVDTTSIREGILFYQDADGNTGYYWDSEVGICAPSLIPTESELWKDQEISGDTPDLDAINYQRIAQRMNLNRKENNFSHNEKFNMNIIDNLSSSQKDYSIEKIESIESLVEPAELIFEPAELLVEPTETLVEPVERMSIYPSTIPESPSSTLVEPVQNLSLNDPSLNDDDNQESFYYDNNNFNLYRQESNNNKVGDNLNDFYDITMDERNVDIEPPSPTSTRDSESYYPTLSQSETEAIAWEYLQHFVGREFQNGSI
ncbi:35626_t:CDS:2 [Gigaspora margarita]|uniref:35626_t:CDS:1 n=1 Tax=Gigaspora margarita TaxID=4874 RepID=A0ABN7VXU3_GIGMA|nr:35626_t:CDS:2 [Gigaspora margarita]